MKLMDIDSDTLGIPDTDYDARVTMPSSEFSRIVRDLSQLGESVRIEVSKEGVRFASEGEAANGNILLRHTDTSGVNGKKGNSSKVKKEGDEEEEVEDVDEEDEDGEKKIKKEKVKKEEGEDVEMNGEDEDDGEFKAESEGEEEQDDDSSSKKRKKAPGKVRHHRERVLVRAVLISVIGCRKACEEGQEGQIKRRRGRGRRSRRRPDRDEPACEPHIQLEVSCELLQELLALQQRAAHDEQRRATAGAFSYLVFGACR